MYQPGPPGLLQRRGRSSRESGISSSFCSASAAGSLYGALQHHLGVAGPSRLSLGLKPAHPALPSPQARCTLSLDLAGLSSLICFLLSQGCVAHTFLPTFPSLLISFLFIFIFLLHRETHSLSEDELLYKATRGPTEKGGNGEGNDRPPQGEVDDFFG